MTADRVVLDTDVVSRVMRGTLDRDLLDMRRGMVLLITFVTVGELVRGAEHAGWGERRRMAMTSWLDSTPVISGDSAVARTWGSVTGRALRAGRPLPANDSWIAACCLAHDLPLVTLNARDFERVHGLELIAG